jgi:hypothetical protein
MACHHSQEAPKMQHQAARMDGCWYSLIAMKECQANLSVFLLPSEYLIQKLEMEKNNESFQDLPFHFLEIVAMIFTW